MEVAPRNLVRIEATFRNSAGVVTEPTAVKLEVRSPAGVITEHSPTKVSTGVWRYDLFVEESGTWEWAFVGTGTVEAAEEGSFEVGPSHFVA